MSRSSRAGQRKFWKQVWLRATAAAGLEGLRIHDMRHTHAAHLISEGVALTGVQRRFSHSSISVTSDLYGHLLPVVDSMIDVATSASLAKIDFRGIVGEPAGETRGNQGKAGEERLAQAA